jgi:pimeloyl-ACP methyl ester carboxylesterase
MDLLDRSWFDKSKITDEIKVGYRAPLEIIGWEEGFWEFNRAPRSFDVKDRLSEITIPTLLITGDTDVVVATADTEALATMIEGSSLVVIPKSGHLAQEETPVETMKAIDDYWISLSK